jgi:hypothetical protein
MLSRDYDYFNIGEAVRWLPPSFGTGGGLELSGLLVFIFVLILRGIVKSRQILRSI